MIREKNNDHSPCGRWRHGERRERRGLRISEWVLSRFRRAGVGGEVTDDATDFGAVGIENEHRGEGVDAKLLRHSRSFSLFHVDLEIDETCIEHFAHFGWGKTSRASFLQGPHQLV